MLIVHLLNSRTEKNQNVSEKKYFGYFLFLSNEYRCQGFVQMRQSWKHLSLYPTMVRNQKLMVW